MPLKLGLIFFCSGLQRWSLLSSRAQRSRLKVEEKEFDFEFEVENVQFNQQGRYVLILTVENPLLDHSGDGVQLRLNDGDVLNTNTGCTEAITQTSLDEVCTCTNNRFVFVLPKGFCKNDKHHDVRLKVEALRVRDSEGGDDAKAGEGFFAVYPRTNAPRINLYVDQGEDLYQYSGVMALLRVHNDYLSMHCGRLVYTVSFHEARPFLKNIGSSDRDVISEGEAPAGPAALQGPTPILGSAQLKGSVMVSQEYYTPRSPEPNSVPSLQPQHQTQSEQLPATDTGVAMSPESLPSTPRSGGTSSPDLSTGPDKLSLAQTPEPFPYNQVIELPRSGSVSVDDFHVSSPGKETVIITLHGAVNLPPLNDRGIPQPFAIVKSGEDEARGWRSRGVTRCTQQPTHCPSWEERVTVELQEQQAHGDVVVLNVADSRSQELLAHYRLPVGHLQPFHHYHLELVQAHSSVPSGVCLYVTVVRVVSTLPRQPHFSFTGLEVLQQAMEEPLKDPVGPMLAVARIVPDYHSYRDAMLLGVPRAARIAVTTVHFPHPSESAFRPPHLPAQGPPQVSQVGLPEEQPVWNHSFLFLERDSATVFTGAAALVLEYYSVTTVMNALSWHIRSPLGFSTLPLHQELYRKLMSETGQRGMRVENLPLRGSVLQTTTDTTPTVSLVLRLIRSERPDSVLTTVDTNLLPCLDPNTLQETEWTPMAEPPLPPQTEQEGASTPMASPSRHHHTQPLLSLQKDRYSLPSYDALAQILPDYQYLFTTTQPGPPRTDQQEQDTAAAQSTKPSCSPGINQTYRVHNPHKRPPPEFEDDPHMAAIADLQAKEVENYRTAMGKMAEDIIALRTQVVALESDNSQLRSDLSLHQDLARDLLKDTDIDVMTKAEMADRIGCLKFKLASETSKAAAHRDKIQQLQNELIRKNDREKELLRLQKAHQQHQGDLQHYQSRLAKTAGLEVTVKQQEKVIEKMEKVLDSKLKEKNRENAGKKQAVKKQTGEADNRREEIESALAAENARLRGELEKIRQQPAPVVIQQLTRTQDTLPDKERLSLLSKLEKAEAKIQTLETQLEENSKRWGRQRQSMLTSLSEYKHGFARTSTTILHNPPLSVV